MTISFCLLLAVGLTAFTLGMFAGVLLMRGRGPIIQESEL